ncbi:MAG: tetratricopeptide repeat protein [Anaerolineales bacterium]|nr:tetratricopeptide repeat protein [Anaerolineales bacterium]
MLSDNQVFQSLETALPSEVRPGIIRRIRRVAALWSVLHDEGFLKKAVSFAGSDSLRWRPGWLGLLSASETEYLRARFATGGASTVQVPDSSLDRGETAFQELRGGTDPALDQAALAALAATGHLDNPAAMEGWSDAPVLFWICLYSIAADTAKVIERLAELLPESAPRLVETVLANESLEQAAEILERCLPAVGLSSATAICEGAAASGEPELARRLGTTAAAKSQVFSEATINPGQRILRARMLRLAGEPAAALPEADAARRDAKRMLMDTLMESARAAEEEGNFTTALSFWQEAGALDPGAAGIRAGIARSLSGLDRFEEAIEAIPSTTEDPEDLLLVARIRMKTGAADKALEAARQSCAKASSASDPRLQMDLADVLAEGGDLRGAAQILHALSRSRPNHPQVFARLADLTAQIGDWQSCSAAASAAWHLNPEDSRSLLLLARSAEHEKRPKEAAEHYRILSGKTADDPALLLGLARNSHAAGDEGQARQAAERCLALTPDCGEAYAILGLLDLAQGNEEAAFAALQKATRLSPKASAPWKALADLHSSKGNREAAATTLRAGIEAASDPADLLSALGSGLLIEGRIREAAAHLERALSSRPNDMGILMSLADASLAIQETADAEEYLNRALAVSPGSVAAVKKKSALLESLGRTAEARAALERSVAAEPDSADLLVELGSLLLREHRRNPEPDPAAVSRALALLTQAEKLQSGAEDQRLKSLIGWAKVFDGRLPEAASEFGSLLQSADGMTIEQKVDAHLGLAEAMLRSGDHPTAVHNLQAALQISPADSRIRGRLGEALAASGLHEDALAAFRKVLADSPDDVAALSGLAESLIAIHRPEEAVEALRQASEFSPADPEPPIRMAEIFLSAGDGAQARSEIARALELAGPKDASIALRSARLLSALKEFGEAAAVLESALERNPASVPLLTELGAALRSCGKNAQAFEMFRRASDADPEHSGPLASAAEALWADGRKSAAIAFLKKAVQLDPKNPALLRRLASNMAAVGLSREALPHYERAMAQAPSDSGLALEAAQAAFRAGDLQRADAWKESGASAAGADGLVLRARIEFEKGEFEKAVAASKQAATAHPEDARTWALLASALASKMENDALSGRWEEASSAAAASALAKACELCAESSEALGLTGRAALALEDYPAAVRCLESLCGSSPDDPEAHVLLAAAIVSQAESESRTRMAFAEDRPADPTAAKTARAALARAAALGADEDAVRALSGRAGLIFDEPDPKAIESLERINQTRPAPENAASIAQAWLRAGQIDRARSAAQAAVNLRPGRETGRVLLGICERKAGRLDAALAELENASRSAPHKALPHAVSAAILYEIGRRGEATDKLRHALSLSPKAADWHYALGVWNEAMGDRAAALPCLQRAAELVPFNGVYHRRFAQALLRDGDPQTALKHFLKAESLLTDESGELHAEIGKAAMESGRPADAYQAFSLALEKPGAVLAWKLGKARAALALGRREEARSTAKDVFGGEGHPAEARLVLAEVEETEGRLPEAIRHLDHAAAEMSDPVVPALRLARLWTATGAAVRSAAAMQALLEAHPEIDEAHYRLAEALLECGRLEDALRAGRKAAELAPRKKDYWILLGRIARKMGQLDQSLAALAKARQISPQDFRTALECGLTYEAEQRWDLALDSYRAAMKLAPENSELHYRMGVVHKNLRAYAEAADELRKAVQIEPGNLAAHKLLSGVMALTLVYGIAPQSVDAR